MGLFDIFKNREHESSEYSFKMVLVDELLLIEIPTDWMEYESDRFRTINKSKSINFSMSNFGKELDESSRFSLNELKSEINSLFVRFEKEGGYIPINDKEATDNFVYQSFKVDDETQYYFYTYRETENQLIRTTLILREIGDYKISSKNLLLKIGLSIRIK